MSDLEDDAMMEKLCDTLDWSGFFKLLRAEYQRGRDDEREENLGRILGHIEGMLPKMVTKEDLDRWAAQQITHGQDRKPLKIATVEEIKPGTDGAPEPEKRTSVAPAASKRAPRANIRGDTTPRPTDIPTTFEMVAAVLDVRSDLTAEQVVDRIRDRWWPGLDFKRIGPELSTWIRKGRLSRDADGKLTLTGSGRRLAFPSGENPHAEVPKESKPPERPAVQPAMGPRPSPPRIATPGVKLGPPARQEGTKFQHGERTAVLHDKEAHIATLLRSAIGKGHLDAKFLANSIGIKSEAETTMRDFVSILNAKITPLGLTIEFYKGFGFIMKECTVGQAF